MNESLNLVFTGILLFSITLPVTIRLGYGFVRLLVAIPSLCEKLLSLCFPPRFEQCQLDWFTFQYHERERMRSAFVMALTERVVCVSHAG